MTKTTKLAIAALVAALATTVGTATPADAKPVSTGKTVYCC